MRFLANENFPEPSIKLLREQGFFVKSIAAEAQGSADKTVIEIASNEELIILTFDKDYGELIFKYGMKRPPSVAFFRDKGSSTTFPAKCLLEITGFKND